MGEQAKHTPGPWVIQPSIEGQGVSIYSAGGYGIGKAWDCNGNPENTANARLIAAAPDLYAAAVEFCRKVDAGEARSSKSYAAFAAAIEKVRGNA